VHDRRDGPSGESTFGYRVEMTSAEVLGADAEGIRGDVKAVGVGANQRLVAEARQVPKLASVIGCVVGQHGPHAGRILRHGNENARSGGRSREECSRGRVVSISRSVAKKCSCPYRN